MIAKHRFKEGWVMLLRPFRFAELEKPLQKMTILYAYSEQPIIKMELNEKGIELMDALNEDYGKPMSLTSGRTNYRKRFGESDDDYEERISKEVDSIIRNYSTQENYQGEIVQCYVEGELCRFYPGEYNVISRETFDHLLTCDEEEYKIEVEDERYFDIKGIKERLFYIRSRGISKNLAMKMNSGEAKDSVIFRPQPAVLEMFCRDYEIY